MNILRIDVNLVEKVFLQRCDPSLTLLHSGKIVIVGRENLHLFERDFSFRTGFRQTFENGYRRCARGETELEFPARIALKEFFEGFDNLCNNPFGSFLRRDIYFRVNLVAGVKDVCRHVINLDSSVLG